MKRLALLALFACAACGFLSKDPGARPVLATIHGELTSEQSFTVQASSGVRVAVVWLGFPFGKYSVAEDLPVQPVFPAAFKIDLASPPPDDVIITKATVKEAASGAAPPGPSPSPGPAPPQTGKSHPLDVTYDDSVAAWPDDFGFAIGAVVAYVDLNQNGKLDLVDEGGTGYVDQIAGANDQTILAYFQGAFPADRALPNGGQESQFRDGDGAQPPDGYSLYHIPHCTLTPLGTPNAPPCTDDAKWLGMDTLYELPLTNDPQWATLMCKNGIGFGGSSSSQGSSGGASSSPGSPGSGVVGPPPLQPDGGVMPDPSLPPPGDPSITCSPDGRSFSYKCTPPPPPPQRLCGDTPPQTGCGGLRLMPTPPPPNWPCTVH